MNHADSSKRPERETSESDDRGRPHPSAADARSDEQPPGESSQWSEGRDSTNLEEGSPREEGSSREEGSRRDDDLLGLGESKLHEDRLRNRWGGGRDSAASRLSGATGREELRILLRMTALGFQFIGEVAAGILIGYAIDWWRGTFPFWTAIFSVAGILIALISLVRSALRMNSLLERESRQSRHQR